ncbi:hypothetical protein AABD41_00075 [Staphylococcus pseudoxylosus]
MQRFINNAYKAFESNDIAIVPVQKGYKYEEHTSSSTKNTSQIDDFATNA